MPQRRPNILLFMTDSMDGRVMRHLGHPAAHTPNLDRLASRGVSFRNAYCNSPQCAPSRASFWSGQYVHRVRAWNNPGGLPMDAPTFGTRLEDAGYGLHVFGKTDYRVGGHSLKARLTAWMRAADIKRPHNPRPQAVTVQPDTPRLHQKDWNQIDAACQFLTNHTSDDPPYLCYPSTNVPHPPFRATQHWLDKIDPAAVTLPPYEADLHPVMDYMSVTKNTHGHFTDAEILAIRRHYFAMVAETDAMLGKVLDTLEATGRLDDTYVIFASDHGEMNMEHRQTLKNALYEASARVPLIVAGPGLRQGVVCDDLVSLIDLFPTLMDIAGLEHPEGLDGVSLLPLCRDLCTTPSVLEDAAALTPSPGRPVQNPASTSKAGPLLPPLPLGEGWGEGLPGAHPQGYAKVSPGGEGWGEGSSGQSSPVTQMSLRRGDATGRPGYVFSEYHSNFTNTGIAMWREGPWKYIRYAGYPPQLFNLDDDPEEIHNLAQSRPDIVHQLNARLESLVDFDQADAQAKANDRHNYQTWRAALTPDEIQNALTNAHQGVWGPNDDQRIETWLAESPS